MREQRRPSLPQSQDQLGPRVCSSPASCWEGVLGWMRSSPTRLHKPPSCLQVLDKGITMTSVSPVSIRMCPRLPCRHPSVSPLSIKSQGSLQDTSLVLHNAQLKPLLALLLRLAAEALGRGGLEDSAFLICHVPSDPELKQIYAYLLF